MNMFGNLAICVLFFSFSQCTTFTYDETRSVSLIDDIDRQRRSALEEYDDRPNLVDHHNHYGEEDVAYLRDSKYTNEWVVEVTGGPAVARQLAEEMGFVVISDIPGMKDMYRMVKSDHPRRSRDHSNQVSLDLKEQIRVLWAEQQIAKIRQKRGYLHDYPVDEILESETAVEDQPLVRVKRLTRSKRNDLLQPPKPKLRFNDELWEHQWYMHDTRTKPNLPRLDLNVLPVYDMGFTGKGVTVVVLDDGLEANHTDLRKNYRADVSYDMNDDDSDPTPRNGPTFLNSHGTRCAGEIAMEANNGKCGVGVAYGAAIGGIRMLDGTVSDRIEAMSLSHALDRVDIYSSSWGPSDDGRTVEGPGRLARHAFYRGITEGRNGKGAIYIWASGNGGRKQDNCNCDGYVSSVYTLSIGSVSELGEFPWYGEKCAATIAVTYSSGAYTDQKIATTDVNDRCTSDHTGTSAAAPLAAGIVALALEANPNLTWRDVQHLVAWTSEYEPLKDNLEWQENAAGFRSNHRFGFGLMNAEKLVKAALNWTTVPEKTVCSISATPRDSATFTSQQPGIVEFASDACRGTRNEVSYLEHVEVILGIEYPVRGNLEIELVSPSGTRAQVLLPRPKDVSAMGFINWPFMSVHTWGEDPAGRWQAIVADTLHSGPTLLTGRVVNATLVLHGTSALPDYRKSGPRTYDAAFSRFQHSNRMTNRLNGDDDVDLARLRLANPALSWDDLIGLKLDRSS